MKASDALASLDRLLAETGEDIILRRLSGQANLDVTCRALVRGVGAKQVVGTITQADLNVIMSPTQILAAGWPSGSTPIAGQVDPRHPRASDFVFIKGKQRQVMFADPIFLDGEWVRCNLLVKG